MLNNIVGIEHKKVVSHGSGNEAPGARKKWDLCVSDALKYLASVRDVVCGLEIFFRFGSLFSTIQAV